MGGLIISSMAKNNFMERVKRQVMLFFDQGRNIYSKFKLHFKGFSLSAL